MGTDRAGFETVSYTHLDVYKRQPQTEGEIYRQAQRGFVLCDRLHHMVFERYMKNIAHRSQHWVLLYLQHNGGKMCIRDSLYPIKLCRGVTEAQK